MLLPKWSKTSEQYLKLYSKLSQPAFTCSKLSLFVNIEHISHLCSSVSIINFEHAIAGWVDSYNNLQPENPVYIPRWTERCIFYPKLNQSPEYDISFNSQKQPPRGFLIEITLRHGRSPVNLLHIFRTTFMKNTSGWLLLNVINTLGHYRNHYFKFSTYIFPEESLHKKWSFPLIISLVNMTKFSENSGFGHIYRRNT